MIKKTLVVKKDTTICDNFADKILTFKCQIENGKIVKIDGHMEVNNCGGGRSKIKLDWENDYYLEKFWREFEELIATEKKSLTKRCVFN